MKRVSSTVLIVLCVLSASVARQAVAGEPERQFPANALKSGRAFLSPETEAQQDDLTINPGMLWVEQGARLWAASKRPGAARADGTDAPSCAQCHGPIDGVAENIKSAATRYPQYDPGAGRLINLEGRINQCRAERQGLPMLDYESDDLLSLTAFVAHQARGKQLNVTIAGAARPFFAAGQSLFFERQGQLNISCAQCHNDNWGKRMGPQPLSQGHPNGFPAYRLEWQTLGSLHRRLRACFNGVRAEPFAPGSPEFINLELYLAARAQGLEIETPAVRR